MTESTISVIVGIVLASVGAALLATDPSSILGLAGAMLGAGGLLIGYNLSKPQDRVESDEPRRNTGYGDGDLRIDKWVDSAPVDEMIDEALTQHGFTVARVSQKESWYGRGLRLSGLAMVSLDTPDDEFLSEVQFDITPTHDHGVRDFSEMGVSLFIPPGWKQALSSLEAE